jgi:hypothetical protein
MAEPSEFLLLSDGFVNMALVREVEQTSTFGFILKFADGQTREAVGRDEVVVRWWLRRNATVMPGGGP